MCFLLMQTDTASEGAGVIQYILGGAVVVFVLLLIVAAATRRVQVRGCCSIAEPDHDLRMRPLEGESVDGTGAK